MKKINILIMALCFLTVASAQQTTKGISTKNSSIIVVDVDVPTLKVNDIISSFTTSSVGNLLPNSFSYNAQTETATFITKMNVNMFNLISVNTKTGELKSKISLRNQEFLGSVFLPRENGIGAFVVEREFNPYQNNDENVSFQILEEGTGRVKGKIPLDFLSLSTPRVPFFGTIKDQNSTSQLEAAISSAAYNVDRNQVVFMARDVTGVNRLYTLDINSRSLISQKRVEENIIDLEYNAATESYKVLYFENGEGGFEIYVGDMDVNTQRISNAKWITKQAVLNTQVQVNDGSIKIDPETGKVYVTKQVTTSTIKFFEIDAESNQVVREESSNVGSMDVAEFEFPYSETQSMKMTALNTIKLYPNPAHSTVNVATMFNDLSNRIVIYDLNGQIVKDVKVESGEAINTLNISNLAPGMYIVDIHTPSQISTRKLSVH